MQWRVRAERHGAIGYLVAYLLQLPSLAILIVLGPFGNVQIPAPLIYMINDEPGNR